jgi:hypothetical protein
LLDTTNDVSVNITQYENSRRDGLAFEYNRRQTPDKLNQQYNPVPDELRVISQPKGIFLSDILSYAYQDENVGEIMVYIIDSGIDKSLPVNTNSRRCLN